MHPHWHSASPGTQRKLISLYIQSLASSPAGTTSPNSFEKELQETRSPHDVAAVLRWGLRHLQVDSPSFGIVGTGDEWEWYKTFITTEHSQRYPPSAFTTLLTPLLPKPHLALLLSILELSGSLAAHAEGNGTSWSRLCMMWGVWVLCAKRDAVFAGGETGWEEFYRMWDKSGRVLEHLFLARIRDESQSHRMPLRLTELVTHYPYSSKGEEFSAELLNRPRFATRAYDALFVRIDTEVEKERLGMKRRKEDLLKLLGIAFGAELVGLEAGKTKEGGGDKVDGLWEIVRQAADGQVNEGKEKKPVLSRVFADETIRLLTLLPGSDSEEGIHLEEPILHRRSGSLSATEPDHNTKQLPLFVRTSPANIPLPPSPKEALDWAQFSSAGFGESGSVGQHLSKTLLDTDVEVTKPSTSTTGLARRMSRKRGSRSRSRRTSVEIVAPTEKDSANSRKELRSRVKVVNIIKLDEAFIDFWSDAVVDPTVAEWPTFVVAKLNLTGNSNLKALEVGGKPVRWVIIERTYSVPPPPLSPVSLDGSTTSHVPEANGANGAASPRPSLRSFSASTKKRFSFLGGGNVVNSGKVEKSTRKTPKIGEMGEILPEVQEKEEKKDEKPAKGGKSFKAAAVGLGAAVLGGVGIKDVADAKLKEEPTKGDEIPVPVPIAEGEALPNIEPLKSEGKGEVKEVPIVSALVEESLAPAEAASEPVAGSASGSFAEAVSEPVETTLASVGESALEQVKEAGPEPVGGATAAPEPVVETVSEPEVVVEEANPAPVADAAAVLNKAVASEPIEDTILEPVEEAAPEPVKEVVPEPVEEAAPEPVEEVAPELVEGVTLEPVEEAASELAEEVAPEPVDGVVPEPAEEVAPEPVEEVAPEPVEEGVPESVEGVVPEPVEKVAPEPIEEVTPEPIEEVTSEPVEEVVPESVEKVILEPAEEAAPEPIEEAAPEPLEGNPESVEAAAEATPVPEATGEPAAAGPGPTEEAPVPAEATPEHPEEIQPETKAQAVPEPTQEPVPQSVEEAVHEETEEPSIPEPETHEDAPVLADASHEGQLAEYGE